MHTCSVDIWDIALVDHEVEDGTRGWGEAIVDPNLSRFTTAATAASTRHG